MRQCQKKIIRSASFHVGGLEVLPDKLMMKMENKRTQNGDHNKQTMETASSMLRLLCTDESFGKGRAAHDDIEDVDANKEGTIDDDNYSEFDEENNCGGSA